MSDASKPTLLALFPLAAALGAPALAQQAAGTYSMPGDTPTPPAAWDGGIVSPGTAAPPPAGTGLPPSLVPALGLELERPMVLRPEPAADGAAAEVPVGLTDSAATPALAGARERAIYDAELREARRHDDGSLRRFAGETRVLLPEYLAGAGTAPGSPPLSASAFARTRAAASIIATRREAEGRPARVAMLAPAELAAVANAATARVAAQGIPADWVQVRPVTIDGEPLVELVGPEDEVRDKLEALFGDDASPFLVGGDPVPDLPRADDPDYLRGLTLAPDLVFDLQGRPIDPATASGRHLFLQTVALESSTRVECSGVLVAADTVLTAAHCACNPGIDKVSVGTDAAAAARTLFIIDRHYLAGDGICAEAQRAGGWSDAIMRKGDLAALVLESDVTSIGAPGSGLRPLGIEHLLAAPAHLDAADYVTVVGFGTTESATFNTRKHRGLIKILSRRCSPGTAGGACAPDQEMIVRNPLRDVDSCFGDSGGPAFVALADGRFAAVAVVSRGLEPDKAGCAEGGIYTLLTTLRVRTWLATLIDPLPAAPASIAVAALTAPAPGE